MNQTSSHPTAIFAVILPAAGLGSRFGGNKLLADLNGVPIIVRSILAFNQRADVAQIVLPTGFAPDIQLALERFNVPSYKITFAPGGPTRAQSVLNALNMVLTDIQWIAVHDAARPLVSQRLIDRCFEAARIHGAVVPARPVHLTIKQAPGQFPAKVEKTIPRQSLYAMQTPQCTSTKALKNAYQSCTIPFDILTDDAQLLEAINYPVYLIEGDEQNIKITTPIDLKIAGLWL